VLIVTAVPESGPSLGVQRRLEGRLVAGLAAGIAHRSGIPVTFVRAAFLVLTLNLGLGAVLYLAGWAATADQVADGDEPAREIGLQQQLGVGVAFVGVLLLLRSVGIWPGDGVFWPAAAIVFGIAVLVSQRDIDSRAAIMRLFDPGDGSARVRTVIGAVLLILGLGVIGRRAVPELGTAILAMIVTGLGLVFVFGPWVWRLMQDLGRERRERIRQEERAEMAAHLHDSVLQTLALIQRSDDPRRVVTLARSQERELRKWLFETAPEHETLLSGLQAIAGRVEEDFNIRVEVVVVGDVPLSSDVAALLAAAGEAAANAAKHSGADKISIYGELSEGSIDVWITDQGVGFDTESISTDRKGISESIVGRMRRNGGKAEVISEPGEGTEVHLQLGRMNNRDDSPSAG